jgi:hypothetical protein
VTALQEPDEPPVVLVQAGLAAGASSPTPAADPGGNDSDSED